VFTYRNGYTVTTGTYWNIVDGRRVDVCGEAILIGKNPSTYLKASVGYILAAILVAGLIYILLMAFFGMMAVASVVGVKILNGLSGSVEKRVFFGWSPKNAYISGEKIYVIHKD